MRRYNLHPTRQNQMGGSVVWKIPCWLTFAGAAFLYATGSLTLAIVVGRVAVLLVVVDIRAAHSEVETKTENGEVSLLDAIKKGKAFQFMLVIFILVAVQVVMKVIDERNPTVDARAFCSSCQR